MLIDPADIEIVRLNLSEYPGEVASSPREVAGFRAKSRIAAGEAIRNGTLDLPPAIPKGKRVKVVHRQGALLATMLGTALEDGFLGQVVQIRNDTSKKVVLGVVKSEEEVELKPER
jgi:flagella basal body P-ring formation protein FlgA